MAHSVHSQGKVWFLIVLVERVTCNFQLFIYLYQLPLMAPPVDVVWFSCKGSSSGLKNTYQKIYIYFFYL